MPTWAKKNDLYHDCPEQYGEIVPVEYIHPTEGEAQAYIAEQKTSFENQYAKRFDAGFYRFIGEDGQPRRAIGHFNISGKEDNCLFRCFAAFNTHLEETNATPLPRKYFVDYLKKNLHDPVVAEYLTKAMGDESKMNSLNAYLDTYLDATKKPGAIQNMYVIEEKTASEQPTLNYKVLLMEETGGFPVALAYLSGVNLNLYSINERYSGIQGSSQLVHYTHPKPTANTRTLNILVYSGHYSLLAFPGDEALIPALEDHGEHNWRTSLVSELTPKNPVPFDRLGYKG
jgi:hypothetical protein